MKQNEPIRTCLGCGKQEKKRKLLRLATTPEGRVVPDQRRGRGGYLHVSQECVTAFVNTRTKSFRSFRVALSREVRVSCAALIESSMPL